MAGRPSPWGHGPRPCGLVWGPWPHSISVFSAHVISQSLQPIKGHRSHVLIPSSTTKSLPVAPPLFGT